MMPDLQKATSLVKNELKKVPYQKQKLKNLAVDGRRKKPFLRICNHKQDITEILGQNSFYLCGLKPHDENLVKLILDC